MLHEYGFGMTLKRFKDGCKNEPLEFVYPQITLIGSFVESMKREQPIG